ncbi:PAS domain S-box protein [Paenibacillus arenosi]|uniref:histidine kinase n=1 Tax=Paenibacillus arenosi TaxID=2774142 RepID=A0ABR9B2A1_9BACL|nr:PAS domain S-box protein [Paenibacillus arenosi]MBD8500499.1 PAS domain S-box protein [Paenibacillus arenosi]
MRLSIKGKLSLSISCTVLVALLLHMVLNYYTTKTKLVDALEDQMAALTQQISLSVEQAYETERVIDDLLAMQLYTDSLYINARLPVDVEQISSEQLKEISQELEIAHISLLQKTPDGSDIVIVQSSDPKEIGLSTKGWGFWYTAMQELFDQREVTVSPGQKFKNFWSGPFAASTSDPQYDDKWGYYYDGSRDYMLNPFIRNNNLESTLHITRPDTVIKQTLKMQQNLLEVTAFNPITFDKPAVITERSDGIRYIKVEDQPIKFGSHLFKHQEDKHHIQTASAGEPVFIQTNIQNMNVMKSYISIEMEGQPPYVLGIVMDAEPLLATLHEQLMHNIAIGLVLIEIVLVGSYILAGTFIRPLQFILQKVNMMAVGQFHSPLEIERNDELGTLASRVNLMADNLEQSTTRLRSLYEENRAMKEQLESFINQSTDAIHVMDLTGKLERMNQAFVDMFGWSEEELLGKPLPNIPPLLSDSHSEVERQLLAGRATGALETQRLTKDGRLLEVSVSTSPIYDEYGNCIAWASITRDITNRKRMEELLRRSEKLTTVGQLAAGVAHEIRNPLTTLKGFLQLQQQTHKMNEYHTDMMLSELDRINLIVSEFLILSKPQAVRFMEQDLRVILSEVQSLLDSQAHLHNIEFTTYFDDVPLVLCEENQLKQVFINVIKNGIEAMPTGGDMVLRLDKLNEDYVRISIQDFGVGIPPEHLGRLGDPFFTNKEKGTGLGLMVSQRIIYNHRGTMEITSEEHVGTIVKIVLPTAHMTSQYLSEEQVQLQIR